MTIRKATQNDLPTLLQLLAQDKLGRLREDAGAPLSPKYCQAFKSIAVELQWHGRKTLRPTR